MKSLLAIAICLVLFTQCKVIHYTADKLPARQIIFGDGGGFTGIETSYTLLENGQLFKQTGVEGSYEELQSIKPATAKDFFSQVASLQLYKMDIEKPGNLYYFIQEVNETIDSRVIWGAGDYVPPANVVIVYRELREVVKNREPSKKSLQPLADVKKEEAKEKEKKEKKDW